MNSKKNHNHTSKLKHSKRNVRAPYKKWTDAEQCKILNFLKNNKPIEKPTAQAFYRRFMAEHGINWDWSLFRCKVRNMRNTYFKLKRWANTEKAAEEKSQHKLDNIQDLLLKKCPLFYEYEQAFDQNTPNSLIANSTMNTTTSNISDTADESSSDKEAPVSAELTPSIKMEFENCVSENEDPICETETYNSDASTAISASLNQMLSRLVQVKREKLQIDLDFKEKQLQLQREMFQFEKEKHYENMRLKDREIENIEKIKIMEIKVKETIALRELEMKERIELARIKRTGQLQKDEIKLD